MSRSIIITGALLCAVALSACSFHARDAESYRKVTREVLETKNGEIKSCYDTALKDNPDRTGTVVVTMTVEKDTGVIKDVKVDDKETKASQALRACVTDALTGLKIDPPDARDGHATFTWKFEPKQPG